MTLTVAVRTPPTRVRGPAVVTALLLSGIPVGWGCAGAAPPAAAGPAAAAAHTSPRIVPADLRSRLMLVADDSMQGRFTGSEGHMEVTDYLAGEMRRLGLRPGGEHGSYFQTVPFVKRHLVRQALSTAGKTFTPMRDFVAIRPREGHPREFDGARVVFGGTIEDTVARPSREEVSGNFVILIYGNTRNRAGNIRTAAFDPRLRTAAAIATVNPDNRIPRWAAIVGDPSPVYVSGESATDQPTPAAMAISASVAAALLGRPADSLVPIGTTGQVVHGVTTFRTESLTVRNVIAILPGADPERAAEYVALGAHSDHIPYRDTPVNHDSLRAFNAAALPKRQELGRYFLSGPERAAIHVNVDSLATIRPARLDSINNGADDDGSGTVGVLEIAEALATAPAPSRPARSVLFVWHAAEEMGTIGSKYFTDHPTVDRRAIVAQINLDMIGRGGAADIPGGGPRYLEVIGWRRLSTELGDVLERVNEREPEPFELDLQFDAPGHPERLYCRSDHYSYARYGIPVAFFTTGLHVDYHEVTDEPQYIDYGKLARVAGFVRDAVEAIANLDHRPVVDRPVPDPAAGCNQ